uniref:Small ribosomal subunit protein bS16m n=1 Tax=Heterorhabditis bacteriophora TaxID=37862 RepID=A0A1I7WIU5_HETBA
MRKLVIPKYYGRPSIGLALFGCANRPFYHICVFPDRALGRRFESNILEQVGTFDPLPNINNEKLVSLNFGRLKYWIGERNAHISVPVLELLALICSSHLIMQLMSVRAEIFSICIISILLPSSVSNDCYDNVMIHYNRSLYSLDSVYDVMGDSKICANHYETAVKEG